MAWIFASAAQLLSWIIACNVSCVGMKVYAIPARIDNEQSKAVNELGIQ